MIVILTPVKDARFGCPLEILPFLVSSSNAFCTAYIILSSKIAALLSTLNFIQYLMDTLVLKL